MRDAISVRLIVPALLLPVLLAACSLGRTTRTSTETSETRSTGSSISLHGDPAEALLERGKQLAMDGDWNAAAEAFEEVTRNAAAKPEHRAAALFKLGDLHSNVLNPGRNYEVALAWYGRVVSEFPESEEAPKAQEAMEALRGVLRSRENDPR